MSAATRHSRPSRHSRASGNLPAPARAQPQPVIPAQAGIRKPSAIAAMVFAALALFAMAIMPNAAFGGDGDADFDWIRAENGRFRDGFATADPSLAAEFVATGINPQTITLTVSGLEYRAVLRGGRYYSNEENPDTSKDIPASAQVFAADGRRLFAAKVYNYPKARAEQDTIIIRQWRGVMGCGLVDYHLKPDGANLTLTKSQPISTKDYSPC